MSDGPEAPRGPATGHLVGPLHVYPCRVYYEDTDAGGIVYHATYLRYCERARTEMMRLLGVPHSAMVAESGVAFAVRRCEIDYLRPARLDDALEVHTEISDIGGATLDAVQIIRRTFATGAGYADGSAGSATDGDVLVHVRLRLACINQSGRPARLPNAVRTALKPLFPRPAP
ncbi:YbgC/FadM family acyl-CoA thioesterase [Rhodospirillum centenum]|uniref:Small, thioesterase-like enzyme subunit, putative n=1 Tax=Rhodospirillum centenum (strain ATCC 51521 / SW) TaxID=414684 RepID=B6ITI3_RHOCS|nr:YbgC/FadM family acyl-CoA thioesterase [Rhodospirillum centenum]ACI99201.1 small, thioesterase-like enzyme subunit, putative [Rhodospirillum centenum SW]